MPSNDTENIYATQYGGEGEPIPATKISYDGTGTSIEATNVQGAITEVDTDLQSAKDDIHDIKEAIDGTALFVSENHFAITADGVKSWSDILGEVQAEFASRVGALNDDELIMTRYIYLEGVGLGMNAVYNTGYKKTDTNITASFERSAVRTDTCVNGNVVLSATEPVLNVCNITAAAVTFTNYLATVPPEGHKVTMYYDLYKRV